MCHCVSYAVLQRLVCVLVSLERVTGVGFNVSDTECEGLVCIRVALTLNGKCWTLSFYVSYTKCQVLVSALVCLFD